MAVAPPTRNKLRGDLLFQRREGGGAVQYVAKHLSSGRFFQLGEVEHFIASQLDGRVGFEELRRRVEERFGAALPPEGLERFIGRLRGLGLLEAESGPAPAAARHLRGSLLYLRLRTFDPDRLLEALATRLRWLFGPWTVAACAAVFALGVVVALSSQERIHAGLPALQRPESLVLVWLTLLAVTVVHEFAHGLTCKHFGGRVSEMGLMLIYFQPAMYCNVSDAWLFPERSKRLWVSFAGAFVEIAIWAGAVLLWSTSDPYGTTNRLALVVMATSGVKTLFNLNPLIKLDGYYLLSDWLEIPNLRARAFAYLRARFGLGGQRGPPPTRRERRIFLAYGLLAGVFSSWLLIVVGRWVGRWLVGLHPGWGLVALVGLTGLVFARPLRRLAGAARDALRCPLGRRAFARKLPRALLGAVALVLLLVFVHAELKVVGTFVVSPVHNQDVRAEVRGIIEEVFAREGDRVASGEALARLADRELRAEREQVAAEIEALRARQRLLIAGARREEIAVARSEVGMARERLDYARAELARESSLYARQLTSLKELDEAREAVAVREKELDASESRLRLVIAGSRPEEREAVAAELARLESRARHLDGELGRVVLTSPIAGVVTTSKLEERIGEYVRRGDLVAEVHALELVTVEIAVPEKDISDVAVGQPVDLKARAFTGRTFVGTVASVAPVVTPPASEYAERTITVTTRLENHDLLLKPQMTGTAKIRCGDRRLVELLTRRLARTLRVALWSLW